MSHMLSEKNETDHQLAMAAMAAYPTLEQASEFLAEQGMTVSPAKLEVHKRLYPDLYEEARRQIAPRLENNLTGNLLDTARVASEAMNVAVIRTRERLDKNMVTDPARTARDLADVIAKSVDKRLALEGRPTRITEHRDVDEIVRSLEAKGIITPAIEGVVVGAND